MTLCQTLAAESDWKTMCKMSIAYGKDYIKYYSENMPTPIKVGDIFRVQTEIEYSHKPPEVNTHNTIVVNIEKIHDIYRVRMHHLLDPVCDSDEIIVACPLVRNTKQKSIPMYFFVVFNETEMYSNYIKADHFFGKIIYNRITKTTY